MTRYFCLCFGLCLMILTAACRQNGAPEPSLAPAPAPEKTTGETADSGNDEMTYAPNERFGKLSVHTRPGDLKFLYGERVVTAEISLGEGFTTPGYLLYPDTENEAEVIFPDGENGVEAPSVMFRKPGAKWRMAGSPLAIGTTLDELTAYNGKPITFLGFGWDYGGTVTDWHGGKLEGIGVTLSYPDDPTGGMPPEALMGDSEVSSENPLLKGKGVYVREILIGLPPPAVSEDGIPEVTNFEIVPGARFGALPAKFGPADLEYTYGAGNVKAADYDLDGGASVAGFLLFPGTKNEVEIGFPDEDGQLETIEFRLSKENSDWHIAGADIRVGDRLAKVRKANGKPLMLYSHNMEGGGAVHDWGGGRLSGLGLQFATSADGATYEYNDEYEVSSDTEAVRKSDPRVAVITVSLEK